MAPGDVKSDKTILAVDIGATTIKFCPVDLGGVLGAVGRRPPRIRASRPDSRRCWRSGSSPVD
jgi:sugar (pentulose or hexulose) kinase